MVSISDTTLPGVSAEITSTTSVALSNNSPGDIGLIGDAVLGGSEGQAEAGKTYRVTTPVRARELFGAGSSLANQVVDALGSGASPVHAAAAEKKTNTVDISGLATQGGDLDDYDSVDGPLTSITSGITFTVDGVDKDAVITYDDPSTKTPGTDEVYVNPETKEFYVDAIPSDNDDSNDTVTYDFYDYSSALADMDTEYGQTVDFIGSLTENAPTVNSVHATVKDMEERKDFAVAVAGAATYMDDTAEYTNEYDTSRLQLLYPSRNANGESLIGSYLGLRAAIGIDSSAMQTRLRNQTTLMRSLNRQQKIDLDAENVVVLTGESRGAMVENDPTCVTDSNSEEANFRDSLSRLITDYASEVIFDVSEPYVGGYHNQGTRNQLRSDINSRLRQIEETQAITEFAVSIEEVDAYTARVNVAVETVKPLRNVVANITAGQIEGGLEAAV